MQTQTKNWFWAKVVATNLNKKEILIKCLILLVIFCVVCIPTIYFYVKFNHFPSQYEFLSNDEVHKLKDWDFIIQHHRMGAIPGFEKEFFSFFGPNWKIVYWCGVILPTIIGIPVGFVFMHNYLTFAGLETLLVTMLCNFFPMVILENGVLDYWVITKNIWWLGQFHAGVTNYPDVIMGVSFIICLLALANIVLNFIVNIIKYHKTITFNYFLTRKNTACCSIKDVKINWSNNIK